MKSRDVEQPPYSYVDNLTISFIMYGKSWLTTYFYYKQFKCGVFAKIGIFNDYNLNIYL